MPSDQLMDTSPGGESTQYESIKIHTLPPNKQSGQLGAAENANQQAGAAAGAALAAAASSLQGNTAPATSSEEDSKDEDETKHTREEQGYDAKGDMNREIGA